LNSIASPFCIGHRYQTVDITVNVWSVYRIYDVMTGKKHRAGDKEPRTERRTVARPVSGWTKTNDGEHGVSDIANNLLE
jgi:hypothetical protein